MFAKIDGFMHYLAIEFLAGQPLHIYNIILDFSYAENILYILLYAYMLA